MSRVNEAVEDGVGHGAFADDAVPFIEGQLRSNNGGALVVAVFDDLHQSLSIVIVEHLQTEVIQDKQVVLFDFGDEFEVGVIGQSHHECGA